MKKTINLIIILTLFIQNIYATGMAVTDVGSYSYYAQQLKSFNDSVKTALDQLESLNKLNEFANKTNELIDDSGKLLYNPTKKINGIISGLQNTGNRFQNIAEKVNNLNAEHLLKNYHHVDEPLKDEIYTKWVDNFEGLFDNSKDETYIKLQGRVNKALEDKEFKDWEVARVELDQYLNLKRIEREQLKKYALLAPVEYYNDYFLNEDSIAIRKERQENIQRLIKQINTVDDVFKQQQTTNEILIEMLFIIQAQYELQMKYYNSVNLTLLNKDVEYKSRDMKDIQKSREKFDNEKVKDKRDNQQKLLDNWYEEKNEIGKNGSIYKMLDIHNNY